MILMNGMLSDESVKVVLYNIDLTAMCSVKNVNSQASLTISCVVNCGQLQCILMVGLSPCVMRLYHVCCDVIQDSPLANHITSDVIQDSPGQSHYI